MTSATNPDVLAGMTTAQLRILDQINQGAAGAQGAAATTPSSLTRARECEEDYGVVAAAPAAPPAPTPLEAERDLTAAYSKLLAALRKLERRGGAHGVDRAAAIRRDTAADLAAVVNTIYNEILIAEQEQEARAAQEKRAEDEAVKAYFAHVREREGR